MLPFLDEFNFFIFFAGGLGAFTPPSSTSFASSTSIWTFEDPAIGAFPSAGDVARAASFFVSDALALPTPVSSLT